MVKSSRVSFLDILFISFPYIALVWLVLSVNYLPLIDYPAHLARMHILLNYHHVELFQSLFELDIRPLPNLGFEILMLPLSMFLPVEIAGRMTLVFIITLFCSSVFFLLFSFQGKNAIHHPTVPLMFALSLNSTFLYGFINYNLGLSIFMLTFALWMRWHDKLNFVRISLLSLLGCLCYLTHFSSFVFLGMSIVVFIISVKGLSCLFTFNNMLKCIFLLPATSLGGWYFLGAANVDDIIEWSNFSSKVTKLSMPFRSYSIAEDVSFIACFSVIVTLIYFSGHSAINKNNKQNYDAQTSGLSAMILSLIFFLAFIISPHSAFANYAFDSRFLLPAVIFGLCALKIPTKESFRKILLLTASLCVLLRIVVIHERFKDLSSEITGAVKAMSEIPNQSIVLQYLPQDRTMDIDTSKRMAVFSHAIDYSTLQNNTISSVMFVFRGQQLVIAKKNIPKVTSLYEANAKLQELGATLWTYDVSKEEGVHYGLVELARSGHFSLWKSNFDRP